MWVRMYLHLGQNVVVPHKAVIGIFDLEVTSQSKVTREFLARVQKEGLVEEVSHEIPASFVLFHRDGKTRVFLSQISATTLGKRYATLQARDK